MRRKVYLGSALVLALIAATLTLRAQHTVAVLVATHNVSAGSQLASSDVRVVAMHEGDLPAGAMTATDQVSGKYVAWPLTSGEPVLSNALTTQRSGSDVVSGYAVPEGYRALAVPVAPAAAVGGLLSPGDRVDVYETPGGQGGSATTNSGASGVVPEPGQPTTLLGQGLLVLQLRSDQGQPMGSGNAGDSSVHGLNFGSGKIGSVVIAVPQDQVVQFAAAATQDTMYVVLSVS